VAELVEVPAPPHDAGQPRVAEAQPLGAHHDDAITSPRPGPSESAGGRPAEHVGAAHEGRDEETRRALV